VVFFTNKIENPTAYNLYANENSEIERNRVANLKEDMC
jgi:hypothetical protein